MKQNKLRQVNKINKNESYYPQLVLKLLDESITSQNNITLYGSAYDGDYAPKLVITYETGKESIKQEIRFSYENRIFVFEHHGVDF